MDLKINDLVERGRLAAAVCQWELSLDGCPTRPPTPADLAAFGDTRSRTDAEARELLRGLFVSEYPSGLSESGEVAWGVEEATAVLAAYVEYFRGWQAKKQQASASGVAGAVREAVQQAERGATRISAARPG